MTHEIVDTAIAKHLPNPKTRELAYNSAHLGDIDIIAILDPFSPSGALSLADPIAAAYGETRLSAAEGSDDSGAASFWHGRRARPLLESIPLTHSTRLALTRGWITARLLGFVTITKAGDASSAEITDGNDTWSLLTPTLGDPKTAWDWFGMTLESALLAEMLASKGDSEPFNALHLLLRLGSSSGSEKVSSSYNTLNPFLASASDVEFGRFAPKGSEPPTDLHGAITVLLDSVTAVEIPPTPGFARVSYLKQLAPLITEAARQMLAAIEFGDGPDDPEDEAG